VQGTPGTTSASVITVTGLPFTIDGKATAPVYISNSATSISGASIYAYGIQGFSNISLFYNVASGSATAVPGTMLGSNTIISFGITYQTT
jgi:hypothetical protein